MLRISGERLRNGKLISSLFSVAMDRLQWISRIRIGEISLERWVFGALMGVNETF